METGKKKPSKKQLEKSIDEALLFLKKDKPTYDTIYFSDKGVRIETQKDYCVISTMFHRHVFDAMTSNGWSRPYLFTLHVMRLAKEHLEDIATERGYSFSKLIGLFEGAEETKDKHIVLSIYERWLYNIFAPLYRIDETAASSFLVFLDFAENISKNMICFEEKKEDLTNLQFIEKHLTNLKAYTKDMGEYVVFEKLTDEERGKRELAALHENSNEEALKELVSSENKD